MSKSSLHRAAVLLALLSAAALCTLLSLDARAQLARLDGAATLHIAAVAAGGYAAMAEVEAQVGEPARFALWTQADGQWVEAPDTARSRQVSVLPVRGDTRLLLPFSATLHEDDASSCLIDAHTARELFGAGDPVGATVRWDGAEYTVRGVLHGPRGTVVVRPATEAAHPADRVTVADAAQASAFAMRHGLSASLTARSGAHHDAARLFSGAPGLLLCWLAAARLGRRRRERRPYPVQAALYSAAMLAAATAGVLLLFGMLPGALIPSRWSDFAFWPGAAGDMGSALLGYLSAALYKPDLALLALDARAALGLAAALCLLAASRRVPAGSAGRLPRRVAPVNEADKAA